jgi:hypothetical protein
MAMRGPVRAIVLLPDGEYELVYDVMELGDIQDRVGGLVELLVSEQMDHLDAYVNEEAFLFDLPDSEWSPMMRTIGFWPINRPIKGTVVLKSAYDNPLTEADYKPFELDHEDREWAHLE